MSVFLLLAVAAVSNALTGDWQADIPPAMFLAATSAALIGGSLVGALVAPFRRLVIGPRFPFVRWGYVAVAAAPVVWMAGADGGWFAKVLYSVLFQIPLGAAALLFVFLGQTRSLWRRGMKVLFTFCLDISPEIW